MINLISKRILSSSPTLPPPSNEATTLYIYRSLIAVGQVDVLLSLLESSADPEFDGWRAFCQYLLGHISPQDALYSLEISEQSSALPFASLFRLYVLFQTGDFPAVIVLFHELSGGPLGSLQEAHALVIQTLLRMDRLDLAETALLELKKVGSESALTQQCEAWIGLFKGEEGIQNACYIYKKQVKGAEGDRDRTAALFNGQTAAQILQGELDMAERCLKTSIENSANDANALINAIVLSVRKSGGVGTDGLLEKLKSASPNHPFVQEIQAKSKLFDLCCAKYA